MAPPIRIEWLEGGEAIDLVQALAVRGLVGKPVREKARHVVTIHDPHEETERLLSDVVAALETWLADRGRDEIEVRVGSRTRTVSARQEDLPDALKARVEKTSKRSQGRP
jgi:hypothetical protein